MIANPEFDFSNSEALVRKIAVDNSYDFALESMAKTDDKVILALEQKAHHHINSKSQDA